MSEEIENKIVPKLRFPVFVETEEWEIRPLKEVYFFKSTNSFSRDDLNYNEGEFKNIHYGDIHTKFSTHFYITKEKVPFINSSTSVEKINKENYCIEGDMVFADASEDLKDVGKSIELVFLNNEKLVSGLHTLLARQIENKLVIGFGGHLFLCKAIRNQIQREAQGAKVLGISATRLSNVNIFYPSNKVEQQKIADCLSSLDNLIIAQKQKLEALKTHKKGLMQQLFPAEGETVPKLRFAEFRESGGWEYSKIEEYIDLLSGIPLKSEELSNEVTGIPILRGINITEGYIRHSKDIDKYYLGDIEAIKRYLILENDLVIGMDGSKVGKNVALVQRKDENSILIQRVARIRANKKTYIKYIYQHIFSEKFQNYVDKVNTSSGIPHISSQQIKDFKIGFPSLREQQKIADCLSSLDETIAAQKEKIEALKTHKKGLMQQLFPCG